MNYKDPADVEGISRFLSLNNYYRKFIPNSSEMAMPLTMLLKKDQ
jgi:hypothetical protein